MALGFRHSSAGCILRRILETCLAVAALIMLTAPAHAYLDPGTGSILLQGLIGAVAGALVVIKLYWARVVAVLRPRGRKDIADPGPHG